jgi:hypothetical protein
MDISRCRLSARVNIMLATLAQAINRRQHKQEEGTYLGAVVPLVEGLHAHAAVLVGLRILLGQAARDLVAFN